MRRIFTVVTSECPYIKGRKVGSKDCTQCDHFRGGIVENFVDCAGGDKVQRAATRQKAQKRPKKRMKKSK